MPFIPDPLDPHTAGLGDAIKKRRTKKFTDNLFKAIETADENDARNQCMNIAAAHRATAKSHFDKGMLTGDELMNNDHFDAATAHSNAANAWDAHLSARQLQPGPLSELVSNQTFGLASDLTDAAYAASDKANEGF